MLLTHCHHHIYPQSFFRTSRFLHIRNYTLASNMTSSFYSQCLSGSATTTTKASTTTKSTTTTTKSSTTTTRSTTAAPAPTGITTTLPASAVSSQGKILWTPFRSNATTGLCRTPDSECDLRLFRREDGKIRSCRQQSVTFQVYTLYGCFNNRIQSLGGDCQEQDETGEADAVFILQSGASISNVIIGKAQAEGLFLLL